MNSRWMNNTIELADDHGKYVNNGFGFSTEVPVGGGRTAKWGDPTFVTVARAGFDPKDPKQKDASECTECHKIHAAAKTPDLTPAFGNRNYQTFENWLDFTTGKKTPAQAKFTGAATDNGTGFKIAYWMPQGHVQTDAADYKKVFESHLDKLRACMAADEADRKKKPDDATKRVKECGEPEVALNNNPHNLAPGAGARIYASLDGGQTFPPKLSFSVASPPNDSGPIIVPPNTSPIVLWEADPNFIACTIESTFPPGVVSATGVGTASNWQLPDQQVSVGTLTVPGDYRFDLHCDQQLAANLTFEISGAPPTLLQIQAIVNSFPGATAIAGTNVSGPTSSHTNARPVDPVAITWSAANVVHGTCSVAGQPTGFSSTDESGFLPITVTLGTDQTYSLSCLGTDSVNYMVQVTVHPIQGTVCDVNEDGKINIDDINAIFERRGYAAEPQDLRDVDGDGKITVNDARICVNRCTKPLCAY